MFSVYFFAVSSLPSTYKCRHQEDTFDSKGKYLKTTCAIFSPKSYNESCIDEDMNLFTIDSPKMETEVLKFATSLFGNGGGSTLWINGRKESYKKLTTENPVKKFFIDSIGDRTVFADGSCLIVSSIFNSFKIKTWPCKAKMFSICEFRRIESI